MNLAYKKKKNTDLVYEIDIIFFAVTYRQLFLIVKSL